MRGDGVQGDQYEPKFSRPQGWEPLADDAPEVAAGETAESPDPAPRNARVPDEEVARPSPEEWVKKGPPPKRGVEEPKYVVWVRLAALVLGLVLLVVLGVQGWRELRDSSVLGLGLPRIPSVPQPPERPERPVPEAGDLQARWYLQAYDLRPELKAVEFEINYNGLGDSSVVIDADDVWGVITFDWHGGKHVVHGIDSATGEELWSRPVEGAYCAAELMEGDLVCAEALERQGDLGTKWRLLRLEPATGEVVGEATIDAWIATMTVHHDVLIIVEQRQPAPHAVMRGFDTSLKESWSHDLSKHAAHEHLFSENRLILRDEEVPDGPALMNPRMRLMSNETTALWGYGATVFVDAQSGKLRAVLPCSRPTDDGERIWCSYGGQQAVAYDYSFKQLHSTDEGISLGFTGRDPKYGDVVKPFFLRNDGVAMKVDLATGKTLGKLVDTGIGDAFGLAISPQSAYAGGHLLIHDTERAFLVDAETYTVKAELPSETRVRTVFLHEGKLVADDYIVHTIDPHTGEVRAAGRNPYGFGLGRAGDELYGYGLDELALLDLP